MIRRQLKPYAFARYNRLGTEAAPIIGWVAHTPANPGVNQFTLFGPKSGNVDLSTANSPEIFGKMEFTFDQINNNTEFWSLFDYYKINMIKVEIAWSPQDAGQIYTGTPAVNPQSPVFNYFFDMSGEPLAASPTSSEWRDRQGLKTVRLTPNKSVKILFKPRVLASADLQTRARVAPRTRIINSTPGRTIPHHGLYWWLQSNESFNSGQLTIKCKYYVTMYGVK